MGRDRSGHVPLRLLLVVMVVYAGGTLSRLIVQEIHLEDAGRILANEQRRTLQEVGSLSRTIYRARTRDGVEELAREELGFTLPHEVAIQLCAPPPPFRASLRRPRYLQMLARVLKFHQAR